MNDKWQHWRLLLVALGLLVCGPFLLAYEAGRWDKAFIAAGAILVLAGALIRNRQVAENLFLVSASLYAGVFLFNLVLVVFDTPNDEPQRDERYLYMPDEKLGYRLTPNWRGVLDDGYSKAAVRINSLGHRDEEPAADPKNSRIRVLLLGDSFTFGADLDQADTIDKKIESTCREYDAYNLGVGGYGIPAATETYRRLTLESRHVYYLFFGNDLQEDNFDLARYFKVHDGYLVESRDDAGRLFTDRELTEQIDAALGNKPFSPAPYFKLLRVRDLLVSVAAARMGGNRHFLPGDGPGPDLKVERAVAATIEMRDTVAARGARFTTVILPSAYETDTRRYSAPVLEYLEGIRKAGIATIELLPELAPKDYWLHDAHFSPAGAQVAANAICRDLRAVRR